MHIGPELSTPITLLQQTLLETCLGEVTSAGQTG